MKCFRNLLQGSRQNLLYRFFVIGIFLSLPSLILGAAGDLDPTFGSGGIVTTGLTGGIRTNFTSGMAIQPDGKILAVGEGYTGSGPGTTWDFAVVRYNSNGSLDTLFGGTGVVLTSTSSSHDGARSVAIQSDGKIVVAGYSDNGAAFAVIRYNIDGSLDTSFNGTGIVMAPVAGYASSVAIQSDGKIVAAGSSNNDFAVIRCRADGSFDTSFNGTGMVVTPVGNSYDRASSVAIQADGKIAVAGTSYDDSGTTGSFAVVRYRTDGTLDPGFHTTGKVITSFGNGSSGAWGLAIQWDGKIVAAGTALSPEGDFALVRYNTSGLLDTTFGNGGKVLVPVGNFNDWANAVAIQPDGKIVVAGASYTSLDTEFAVVRVNPNGALDTTFNGSGKVVTVTPGNEAAAVAIQADGKIVVAGGYNESVFGFMLVRYQGGPVTNRIAFTSNRDGNQEIYVVNDDSTDQRRLTNNPGTDCFPRFSPNGRTIAFISENAPASFAIKLMDADGTNQKEITPIVFNNISSPWQSFFSLAWSPDSRKIAFQEDGDIISINVDGSERQNLTNHPAMDSQPAWSPDGLHILFISSRDTYGSMFTMKTDGSDVRALPNDGPHLWDASPDWAPSGNKIVFVVRNEKLGPVVGTADADGTNRQLFDNTILMGYLGARNNSKWSPDGSRIAFDMAFGGNVEIFIKNADSSGFRFLTDTVGWNFQPSWQPPLKTIVADFDGDGRSDISVFRPTDRVWYLNQSTAGFSATQFGLPTDKITPADYDGDGKTDIAVFRDGVWYRLNSSNGTVDVNRFGLPNDIPVPGDFTGDGRSELAIYRGGVWWSHDLTIDQTNVVQFGISTDKPVPDDYDGDGRADQAVYRNGEWHLNRSTQGYTIVNFGLAADKPVAGDYDGDGRADQAVYRDGTWHMNRSTDGIAQFQFGLAADVPAPADYDGDGKTDAAVYRNGVWYLLQTTSGIAAHQFGLPNDKPIPAAYLP